MKAAAIHQTGTLTRAIVRKGLAAVLIAIALLWLCTAQASAATAWWHLTTISSPAKEAGGEAQVIVEAANLGDAAANELNSPVTLTEFLPRGVAAVKVAGQGDGITLGEGFLQEKAVTCSLEPHRVSCSFPKRVGPYERVILVIDVTVAKGAGGGLSEARVSGGSALPAVSRRALALEGHPGFGVATYELQAEEEGGGLDTQAGSHPFQLTATFVLNSQVEPKTGPTGKKWRETVPLALTKDLRFNLPAGLLGNPAPLSKCSIYVFSQEARGVKGFECPLDTVVGVASTMTSVTCCVGHAPLAFDAPIYILEPAVGEPARFGFETPAGVPVVLDASVRTGGDYGVTVSTTNTTQVAAFLASQTTFWGVPADPRHDTQRGLRCLDKEVPCPLSEEERKTGQPFLIMPTSCGPAPSSWVEGDTWTEPGIERLAEYTFQNALGELLPFDGCNRLNFEPSIALRPDGTQASSPTGLTVDAHVPQNAGLNPGGLAESAVKSITVALPEGIAVDPSGADGLQACTDGPEPGRPGGQIALQSSEPVLCPEESKIGTITATTPLWPEPFTGAMYLATQNANPFGSLLAIYIVVENKNAGVVEKLAGEVKLTETGQLITTVKVPQLPFEDAELHFFGGSRAPLGTPAFCGEYRADASFTPWAENGVASVSSPPFAITSGPDGSACANPLPFAPSLDTGSLNIQAAAFTPFTMTMSRADGNQSLQAVQLHMSPGLLGLVAGVKLCEEPQADLGTCGPESLIGHTSVSVGLGGNPYTVTGGEVFLTGPYHGAPYGLSIVNPAKAGPFDLEKGQNVCDCVVVRARIDVDPLTSALTVTTDSSGEHAIPHILRGIPLQIQHVNVTIDRPSFTFNPTNCSKQAITAELTSDEGRDSRLQVPFQVTNCARLAFKPQFKAWTSAHTSRRTGASLNVRLTYPKTAFGRFANIAKVKVELPRHLPSRLETLQKACPDKVFNVNPASCPAASRVGAARATTPVLTGQLAGPAYFVSHGGTKFPELVIVLSGNGVTVQLHGETFIAKGITSSTFPAVPDVPIGTFTLTLPQGPYSALAANGNLCKGSLKMPTTFDAQNGLAMHKSTRIVVTGCRKHRKAHRSAGHHNGRPGRR